ncbi:MAG: glycosyltransferase family 9 protein, partial [Gemmatimonadota bacterium]
LRLDDLISFVSRADALIAASTGPLHLAAALGREAIGLYSPKRPRHPDRWAPVGKHAHALVFDENCEKCREGMDCACIEDIPPSAVYEILKPLADRLS